jgi:hypothetical protein
MPKGLFAVPRRRGRRGFETVAFPHHTASRRTNLHAVAPQLVARRRGVTG